MITLVSSPWGLGPTIMHRTVQGGTSFVEVPQYWSISNLLMHLMLSVLNEYPLLLFWLHSYVTCIKLYWAYCEGPDRTVKNRHSTWKEGDIFTSVSRRSTKILLIPFTKVTRGQRLGQLLLYWSQKKDSTFFFSCHNFFEIWLLFDNIEFIRQFHEFCYYDSTFFFSKNEFCYVH